MYLCSILVCEFKKIPEEQASYHGIGEMTLPSSSTPDANPA
jgi:hypothetical protein